MRRVAMVVGMAGILAAGGAAMAQSPGPSASPAVLQDLCIRVLAPEGLNAVTLTNGIMDGTVNVLAVVPCTEPGSSPAPSVTSTPEPTPAPTKKPAAIKYQKVSDRTWSKIMKSPDKYLTDAFQVWACITQFDAATGGDTFRAQALGKRTQYWYIDGDNALFTGDEDKLADYVEGDVVSMNVLGGGSFSYDTQIGGSTTVPWFLVQSIKHRGSCD